MSDRINLQKALLDHGCEMRRDDFEDMLQELHADMFPSWTDEELLYNPSQAILYINKVREKSKCFHLPDSLVLKALNNMRKRGRGKRVKRVKRTPPRGSK